MLDTFARIKDESLSVTFPLPEEDDYEEDYDALNDSTRNNTTGY